MYKIRDELNEKLIDKSTEIETLKEELTLLRNTPNPVPPVPPVPAPPVSAPPTVELAPVHPRLLTSLEGYMNHRNTIDINELKIKPKEANPEEPMYYCQEARKDLKIC